MLTAPITPTETHEERQSASEIKFLLTPAQAGAVRDWARRILSPDPHAADVPDQYRVTSLYFDTPSFDVFRGEGSFGRAKYRIRQYGSASRVFLERKLKSKSVVTKRRTLIETSELTGLDGAAPAQGWPGFWFHRRLAARQLAPVCAISYLRTARIGESPLGPLRLTIDQDLRAAANPPGPIAFPALSAFSRSGDLTNGRFILELKYRHQMPAIFKQLAEQFRLVQRPLSKYRMAVSQLGLPPGSSHG